MYSELVVGIVNDIDSTWFSQTCKLVMALMIYDDVHVNFDLYSKLEYKPNVKNYWLCILVVLKDRR